MRALVALLLLALPLAGCAAPAPGSGAVSVSPEGPAVTSAWGRVVAAEPQGEALRLVLEATAVDCEVEEARFTLVARLPEGAQAPEVGADAGVEAMDGARNGTWVVTALHPTREAYAGACAWRHANDLVAGPTAQERASGTASQIVPVAVALGGSVDLSFELHNRQDQPLGARILRVALLNEEVYHGHRTGFEGGASEEERFERARIARCGTAFDAETPVTVEKVARVPVVVHCPQDADPRPAYEDCSARSARPGPAGDPAGGSAADPDAPCVQRLPRPVLALWARVRFLDELGAEHVFDAPVRQALHVGQGATLHIEAPARAEAPEDLVVHARYLDADGAPVPNAHVTLRIDHAGIHDRAFPMRWDEVARVWTFRWSDLAEWQPAWVEGPHRFEFAAQESEGVYVPASAATSVTFG